MSPAGDPIRLTQDVLDDLITTLEATNAALDTANTRLSTLITLLAGGLPAALSVTGGVKVTVV